MFLEILNITAMISSASTISNVTCELHLDIPILCPNIISKECSDFDFAIMCLKQQKPMYEMDFNKPCNFAGFWTRF